MSSETQTPVISAAQTHTGSSILPAAMLAAGVVTAMAAARPAHAVTPALKFSDIPGAGDIKVLNYALALEDLEADLYAQAVLRLTTGGTNKVGKTIPGLGLSGIDVDYINEFAPVEAQHRDFLRGALGGAAITPFKYDFGIESKSRAEVSALVYLAEQTGVGAYLGAIPYFATKTYLPVAAGILGTEARHTTAMAIVQNRLFGTRIETAPLANENNGRDTPVAPDTVLANVSPFIITS